jgi:hypothetical protein
MVAYSCPTWALGGVAIHPRYAAFFIPSSTGFGYSSRTQDLDYKVMAWAILNGCEQPDAVKNGTKSVHQFFTNWNVPEMINLPGVPWS